MDITLKIKADFAEASSQFENIANNSDYAREKIERFTEKFKTESIDRFIDRQDILSVAMKATGRDTDVLNMQINAYQREIERLIKSGLDPQDESIKKLQNEYIELKQKQEDINQATSAAAEAAEIATEKYNRLADEIGRLIDAEEDHEKILIKLNEEKKHLKEQIQDLIKSGLDPESSEVKKLEAKYKELTREIEANEAAHKAQETAVKAAKGALLGIGAAIAAAAGLTIKAAANVEDQIASFVPMMGGSEEAAKKMFKTIQKEAATTPFEIESITSAVRTMMPAFKGSATESVKAFRMLGDTAQGNSQKLQSITSAYTKSIMKNKVSMQELNIINSAGVPIFNEMAESMGITVEKLMDMSRNGELTGEHLTGAFQKMTSEGGIFFNGMETASDTFNMRLLGIKENAGILAGVIGEKLLPMAKDIAGVVLKVVERFTAWVQEGNNFNKMMDNLTYATAGATAGLIAFLIAAKGSAIIETVKKAVEGLTSAMAKNPIGAIAVVITAVLIPALIYLVKNWDTVETYMQQGIARLEYAFNFFTQSFKGGFNTSFDAIKIGASKWFEWWFAGITFMVRKTLELVSKIPGAVGDAADRALAGIQSVQLSLSGLTDKAIESSSDETKMLLNSLDARLSAIDETARARRAEIEAVKNALSEELDATVDMQSQRVQIYEEANKAIGESNEELKIQEKNINDQRLRAANQLFGGLSSLLGVWSEKHEAAALAAKGIAHAEAGINSALAFTKTLNDPTPMPTAVRVMQAAGVLAAGLAQQIKIQQTPISAETGGRFVVPDFSTGVDSVSMRVNPGEKIDVTPRGEYNRDAIHQIINLDGQVFVDFINRRIRAGDIYEMSPAWNM